jgi:hypothetical protein
MEPDHPIIPGIARTQRGSIHFRNEEKAKSAITELKDLADFLVCQIFCGGVHKVRLVNLYIIKDD